jgi:hypothetical protein
MQCHKCPHLDSIQRGDYDSKPWKDTPCAKCKLGEDSFYSVPFDEEYSDRTAGVSPALSAFSERTADDPSAPLSADLRDPSDEEMLPVAILSTCFRGLMLLPPELRDIVAMRFQGFTYKEIALRQGTSVQVAEQRHQRAIRTWPALKDLFPVKIAKQALRKSRR